jgi:hypothetical protein
MTRRAKTRSRWHGHLLALATAGALALAATPTGTAQAHDLGFDSVDGCQIRWEDETTYDTERQAAQSAWEALRGDACVDLLPDAWDTVADLEWKNANRSDVAWAGSYEWEVGADDIHINTFYMQGYDACTRKNVAMHELGHAHGIDHSSNSWTGNVMNQFAIPVCALKPHDISDYESLWGTRNPPPRPTTTCERCEEP